MQNGSMFRRVVVGSLLAACGVASHAALVTYGTLSAFTAATSSPGVDTYAGFSNTSSTVSPINRSAGAYTYTATTSDLSPIGSFGFFGAGTSGDPWLSPNYALDTITFTNFSSGVVAIGGNFFGSDLLGAFAAGNIVLEALDTEGSVSQTLISPTTSSFFGFVSTTALVSLKVSAVRPTNGSLWPTIDNLVLAQGPQATVAEPATIALASLGLLAAVGLRRRAST